ncbi:MAG: polysaccharide deacetylase family protein [Bacteroidaceae bacterium]|nr:polysaccharide deacetylase family protein [Bacteroidales bacterium]MBQ3152547.1 polysaccharide deacetylase family protein [Bacteroidaceae bacterium]MBQ4037939.1 polysaccharide deacetylase family protein [Bacteroidaceae bacterium]MBR6806502.1 polysaccharide deacetylase family protein [Bacteroidaceae bacterium]
MFIEQVPPFFRRLYPQAIWRMDPDEKAVYLTFDDGPIPEVTPWVLSVLARYNVKATFFMVGDNVHKFPDEYRMVVEGGHRIGNHTFNHKKGIFIKTKRYVENVDYADAFLHTNLFRPPHGIIRRTIFNELRKRYKVVMWDVVTRDYSFRLYGEDVLANIKKYVRNGSIITFHDSMRSYTNLKYALPRSIEWLLEQGYTFKVIE